MKRYLLLVLLVGLAAIAALIFTRRGGGAHPAVAALLPADTAFLLHIPDIEQNSADWRRTELYALLHEPAVEKFLRKPKSQVSFASGIKDTWREVAFLRIRDAFVAINDFDSLRLVGGFEFRCGEPNAQRIIEQWKSRWLASAQDMQRGSVEHGKHTIDLIGAGTVTLASTMAGNWFFAATNLDDLKTLLDRADHSSSTPALEGDGKYRAAMKQLPREYAWALYLQPKLLAQKLARLRDRNGRTATAVQPALIERIDSLSHATVFNGGKMREVTFTAMPRATKAKLSRDTLAMASADTVFYLASVVNLAEHFIALPTGNSGLALQKFTGALSAANITTEDWRAAFGEEFSVTSDWPQSSRLPSLVATLNVQDAAPAKKIVGTLSEAAGWEAATRNGALYFASPQTSLLTAINPTVGVSDRLVALGVEGGSVHRALAGGPAKNPLANTTVYREATKQLPEPQDMFAYVDLANFYQRLDTMLRPLVQMSAAFVPAITSHVEPDKLPPAEMVTRHLSPIAAEQTYLDGGYRCQSIGPITLGHVIGGALAISIGAAIWGDAAPGSPRPPSPAPIPSIPAQNPTPTP